MTFSITYQYQKKAASILFTTSYHDKILQAPTFEHQITEFTTRNENKQITERKNNVFENMFLNKYNPKKNPGYYGLLRDITLNYGL